MEAHILSNSVRYNFRPVFDGKVVENWTTGKQIDTINNKVICLEQMAFSFAKRGGVNNGRRV